MNRFHVHLTVADLALNIRFYSALFGQPPATQKHDYAKWMLDDPQLNFALSSGNGDSGLNHFGMQAGDSTQLQPLRERAAAAGADVDEYQSHCCYAESVKHWLVDPQGIAWEHFVTMRDAEVLTETPPRAHSGCCASGHGG